MYKTIEGECPERDCAWKIRVEYLFVSNRFNPSHKKKSYRCEYSVRHGCQYTRRMECPIFAEAPESL